MDYYMKRRDARKLHPKAQEAIGLGIVDFLKAGKGTQNQAANIFKVSLRAVKKIGKQFKQGGAKALKARKCGPHPGTSLLSEAKVTEITSCIKNGTPDNYELPYYLWTAKAVGMLIKKKPK
jgi:transposase